MDIQNNRALRRPDPALFYRRNDANDVRLGEIVRTAPADYDGAQIALLGCPQDEGVWRNGGRPGAARAPTEIRRYLYRLTVNGLADLALFDLGDTIVQGTLEDTHARHQEIAEQVLRDGKRLIVLGGGNDISFPDAAALAAVAAPVVAFNVDAHFDVRADARRNSGTAYRQLLEGAVVAPERLFEIGYQPFANSPVYAQYLHERGVTAISLAELRRAGIFATLRRLLDGQPAGAAVFWGIDLDVVQAADAPGVSAPNPVGMAAHELCDVLTLAGAEPRTRLVEFTEVNPDYDQDGRTCRLTAAAVWHFLAATVGVR